MKKETCGMEREIQVRETYSGKQWQNTVIGQMKPALKKRLSSTRFLFIVLFKSLKCKGKGIWVAFRKVYAGFAPKELQAMGLQP